MEKGTKLFKNTTLTEKTILFLKERGFSSVSSRTGKYKVFKGDKLFYFVGKGGAVRINNKNAVSGSKSITASSKIRINDWANIQNPKSVVEV